jgi:hypothetical protein
MLKAGIIIQKILDFMRKNIVLILVLVGVLIVSGGAKHLLNRYRAWLVVRNYRKESNDQTGKDYTFMSMTIHEALRHGLFKWGEDEKQVIKCIDELQSMEEFMLLCTVYFKQYKSDLREDLRRNFGDARYNDLKFK